MRTEQQIASELSSISYSIQAAEATGKSDRYTAKLYKQMFKLEDELKSFKGGFK